MTEHIMQAIQTTAARNRRWFLGAMDAVTLSGCGGGDQTDSSLETPLHSNAASNATTTSALATPLGNKAKARVIVVGGGMAGANVAKYVRMWGDAVDVTLIEREPQYTSCIMSSLVLSGQRSLDSLVYRYDTLRQ